MLPYLTILCTNSENHTTLKIPINFEMFNYCTQSTQNSKSLLIMNISKSTGIQRHVYRVPHTSSPPFLAVVLVLLLFLPRLTDSAV